MAGEHEIELGHDVTVVYGFTDPHTVAVSIRWRTDELFIGTLGDSDPHQHAAIDHTTDHVEVRAALDLAADFLAGAVTWSGDLAVRDPLFDPPTWTTLLSASDDVVFEFDPTGGLVDGSPAVHLPVIPERWGPSGASGGSITRFHVRDGVRIVTDVGSTVRTELFGHVPPFTVNVVAGCGHPTTPGGPGVYGDPESRWFNAFFGVYQVDCAIADGWTRPFGYASDDGVASELHADDLLRLGIADWNWFSNFLYGVPRDVCIEYGTVTPGVVVDPVTTAVVGSTTWHRVGLTGVVVASCYQSDAPGSRQLADNSIITPHVRQSFGLPCPRPGYPTSFVPTTLHSVATMTYWRDDAGFHTLTLGGTCRTDSEPEFLADQRTAAEAVIAASYPDRGFANSA
jgi:hypothetical protein